MYCNQCLEKLPQCAICGEIIVGTSITYPGYEGQYCLKCAEKYPKCVSCGRPAGPGSLTLSGGDKICSHCRPTALLTQRKLNALATEIKTHLADHLLLPIKRPIEYSLTTTLQKSEDGYFRENGKFICNNGRFSILIQKGLSRSKSIETMAHELAHAWQAENIPGLTEPLYVEGFAQWVASKVLANYGIDYLIERMDEREDIYGDGYRRMLQLEKRLGVEGMFRHLRNTSR